MPDAATSASTAPDIALLDAPCRALAEAADAVGEAPDVLEHGLAALRQLQPRWACRCQLHKVLVQE
ncbi:hypothetical protein, partial [Streptomyces sp. NPDC089795]|uniref:hypothetical protein n=1 Tax=Streptomyces sp. NPDC089795 TaxID=3155297 RepID=UPI00341AAB7A